MPKRVVPLTDVQVKNAKPKDKDYKLSDGFGLVLLVKKTGGKLWHFNYTYEGKQLLGCHSRRNGDQPSIYQLIMRYIATALTTGFTTVSDKITCNSRQLATLCVSRFIVNINSETWT